jgi:hypothetical protein
MAGWMLALAAASVGLWLTGCAGKRIEGGVFHGGGYRVTLPTGGWRVMPRGPADLELQREGAPGGMVANASCGREAGRGLDRLIRQLLSGLKERSVLEQTPISVDGRAGERVVFEGTAQAGRVKGEAYVLKGGACVYDLLYVAPAAAFDSGRADFERFATSLTRD